MIKVKERFGFIDRTGKFVIAPSLLYGSDFQEGKSRVVVEGPCMRWDPEQPCDSAETLGERDTAVQNVPACRFVFIDKSGRWISEEKFENAKDFSEGFAAVQQNGKWGFIDSSGVVVIDPKYDRVGSFSDGLARVKQGELWGFIDSKGKVVIPIQFEDVEDFADGLVPVGKFNEENKEWEDYYFIDKTGKRAFEGTFEKASHFFKGLAHVKLKDPNKKEDDYYLNGKYAYINTKGKKIFAYVRNSDDDD